MAYDIVLAPQAVDDLRALAARDRSAVADAMERHLRHGPTKVSRSRNKRLRGLSKPQFRLRIGELRVFYDVADDDQIVEVLAILSKEHADAWLEEEGEQTEASGPLGGEG